MNAALQLHSCPPANISRVSPNQNLRIGRRTKSGKVTSTHNVVECIVTTVVRSQQQLTDFYLQQVPSTYSQLLIFGCIHKVTDSVEAASIILKIEYPTERGPTKPSPPLIVVAPPVSPFFELI